MEYAVDWNVPVGCGWAGFLLGYVQRCRVLDMRCELLIADHLPYSDDPRATSILLAQYEGNLLRQFPAHCYSDWLHGFGLYALLDVRTLHPFNQCFDFLIISSD